jgi:hypothetical protein
VCQSTCIVSENTDRIYLIKFKILLCIVLNEFHFGLYRLRRSSNLHEVEIDLCQFPWKRPGPVPHLPASNSKSSQRLTQLLTTTQIFILSPLNWTHSSITVLLISRHRLHRKHRFSVAISNYCCGNTLVCEIVT